MTMKRLFRHTLLRTSMMLGAMILVNTQTKAQIENVTTGVIASQGDVATYNTILDNYPVDISSMVPDIKTSWGGLAYNNNLEGSGQHWDGTSTSTYYDRWNGSAFDRSTFYKNTTINLSRGRYAVLTAARGGSNGVTVYLNVMSNNTSYGEVQMAGTGDTGKGINTSGDASFGDGSYANGGNGHGWKYFYIQFEVTADNTPVELRVSGSCEQSSWMSFTTPKLLAAFTEATSPQPVEKAFVLNESEWLQNDREFTVQFSFENDESAGLEEWKLYLFNKNGEQVASLPIDHEYGSGPEGYWYNWAKFHDHTLQFDNGNNNSGLYNYYVRWYLKDKSGNLTNINNGLRNDNNINYQNTLGLAWSSKRNGEKDLQRILRMTVDGTPDGGASFDLRDYDLVCVISEAGNESYVNNTYISDASPINIEYIFHFENRQMGISLTDKEVTHKISYLQQYAQQFANSGLALEEQGLVTEAQSDWWNYSRETQKVNQFEITHYVKLNEEATYLLPTAQNTNDHTMYQRWYNYNDEEDIVSIQSHVTLNGNGGSVPYYIYKNGLVTGDRIYWGENRSFLHEGDTPYAYTTFTYKNVNGDSLTVAADVSRYSDMAYEYPSDKLSGNLEEPSLTMRYIYYMKDAREMAAQLTEKTFQGVWSDTQYEVKNTQNTNNANEANWLEKKVFHFPSRQLAYEKDKAVGYRGEFLGLRHRFSDYWVFDSSTPTYDSEHPTSNDDLNDHLIHGNTYGNIVVRIYDPNGTGIRLGGYNPSIDLKSGTTWATPAAQVGDIIRVNITAKGDDFNPRFKYGNNFNDFWPLLAQINNGNNENDYPYELSYLYNSNNVTDDYFQATINSTDVLNSLTSNGLRFQGVGFTMTSVELIHNGESTIIWSGNRVFDGWGVRINIDANKFAGVENTTYNEGEDSQYLGFYYHDKMYPWNPPVDEYGSSRFLVFRYPESGKVENTGKEVYLRAYFVDPNNTSRIFQLAQYTLIFDEGTYGDGCATLPLKSVNGGTNVKDTSDPTKVDQYTRMDFVEGTPRDPRQLRARAGKPIAQITFDYPTGSTYHFPEGSATNHGQNRHEGESYGYENNQPYIYPDDDHPAFDGTIPNSSPIPLIFDKSNYAFDGENALFGAYAMLGGMNTRWGNQKACLPADDATYGYNIAPDEGYDAGFLYIDASELPGDICSAPFVGDFCPDDHLLVSGWISGANNVKNGSGVPNDGGGDGIRSPGGITLTLKGEHTVNGKKKTETLYRFCPGMCYELDNGSGSDGNGGDHVVWQQFYFDFHVQEKYERHWIEVNNNCVSSQGGDFMLDNIEVYCIVPEVEPTINTPLCISVGEDGETVTDMRLLKLTVNYNKLMSSRELESDGTCEEGFVFLDKYKFLETFKKGLKTEYPDGLHGLDFNTITLDELALAIEEGRLEHVSVADATETEPKSAYKTAFDAAILGSQSTWHSDYPERNMGSSIMFFRWNSDYEAMEEFTFERAANKKKSVFREEIDGEQFVVMNGNYPGLKFRTNTDYYVINTGEGYVSPANPCEYFNLCSPCCRVTTFQIEPPLEVVGLDAAENTEDLVVCNGQIPTLLTNLKGYDIKGNEIKMQNLNFDWWLGNKTAEEPEDRLATLDNYHKQFKLIDESLGDVDGNRIYLAYALSVMRAYYPGVTSLDGIKTHEADTEALHLTDYMIDYLREVVDAGELLLHQSAISVPAEQVLDSDPYFYLVACPIHDEAFSQALNPSASEYVAFYCDEPQGVRIKLGQKAPTLHTGFVPGEHGFTSYNYDFPANTNPVLSIRLAKAAQFETVKEQTKATDDNIRADVNYLWLPIRNARTEGADGVIKKSEDDNVYLAASNDLTWDKKISKEINKNGLPPVVGRIVQLDAINTSNQSEEDLKTNTTLQAGNRLCIYFKNDFNVREGYNYTLSLPFQEELDSEGNPQNACDGTILINLKIVPDYEVWTGAAGNTDWNNDENWRRADGNTAISNDYYGDELYRANGAVNNDDSPLHTYTTNKDNYYSSSKKATAKPSSDQILRKGFAPLYCTHVLMKSDEWGNAPILYDAIDSHDLINGSRLVSSPFPNLRETSTPILKFDMQARRWDMWEDTYGVAPDRGYVDGSRPNDLIAEMYQINSCDEIAMQPGTELRNAQLLNYNSAWMEFELDAKRWYLLGSPLQGTISGEWYAPTGTNATEGAPLQKTTYYDDVKFGAGYDRYNPAIYQRSWDKAKAVLYEVGSIYSTDDDNQGANLGNDDEGIWSGTGNSATWNVEGGGSADQYLDRLGYKPMGGNKANVAIKGIWSNAYNDAQVDYATGGFSVMVMNHLKGKPADVKAIVRLPKEDTMYDYYRFSEDGSYNGGTDTNISDVQTKEREDETTYRATNRGRLKTDLLLPTSVQKPEKAVAAGETYRYGDRRTITHIPIKEADLDAMNGGTFSFTETVPAGESNLGYYLVENPFPCGLDMNEFFKVNGFSEDDNPTGPLQNKYWLLTKVEDGQNPRQVLVQQAPDGEWVSTTDEPVIYPNPNYVEGESDPSEENLTFYPHAVLAPGQGFFVEAADGVSGDIDITFTDDMQAKSRFGVIKGKGKTYKIVVGQAQEMERQFDINDDGVPETPLYDNGGIKIWVDTNGDGVAETQLPATLGSGESEYEGEMIWIDTDGDEAPDTEKNVLNVLLYEEDPDTGEQIPKLRDIEEDVVIYNYVQETITKTPDDESTPDEDESEIVDKKYPLLGRTRSAMATSLPGLVITARRDNNETSALVMQREQASNDFLPTEDTETFITSDFENVPTVYTLCGRLATAINSIHDFRSLPIGVESNNDAPCVLTFQGVEMLGDSISFYDAVEQTLIPLKSGMQVSVSGQTQNRYYLVRSLIKEEAAEETHLQIFTEGLTAKVIASTAEPILNVRCFDTAGRLIHKASPETVDYSFSLPRAGIYIIEAETENDHKIKKVMTK